MNESWHTHKWVTWYVRMSHVVHRNESCHTYELMMCHKWNSMRHMSDCWCVWHDSFICVTWLFTWLILVCVHTWGDETYTHGSHITITRDVTHIHEFVLWLMQHTATDYSKYVEPFYDAWYAHCNKLQQLQNTAIDYFRCAHCNTLQHTATDYSKYVEPFIWCMVRTLQQAATNCNTLQETILSVHTVTQCNTLQYTATDYSKYVEPFHNA